MSFMKNARRTVAAGAMLAAMSASAFAQEVTLKMHQFLPAQASVPSQILDVWADKVEAESGGKIKIERYPSMQLGGKPPELADQVVDGIADIVWTVTGYSPGRFPRSEAFEMPFSMTNAEDTSRAYWEFAEKNMLDKDFAEMKMLAVWVHGPGLIHSKNPIASVADLNGVKLRAPTRVTNKLFSTMGATPVGMPVPAVPEALSKGVIDATVIPWEVTSALKVSELVANHTEFGADTLYTTTFIFAMNKDKYESLSDELKAVIDANSGADVSAWAGKIMQEADAPARKIAVDRGNTIITLTPEQVAEWKAAAAPIEAGWVEEVSTNDLDGQALLDEAKALIAKHSK
ncbi:MAG: TRAP transporter substrate-binding protein [Paracoccaceae bacterium]